MSGQPSGSGTPSTPKAIASLAKKQADVTRQGTQKLKFVPVLPARRKKDSETQPEPPPTPSASAESDRGHGRGRGRGRGDLRGRGAGASARPTIAMTASGPFALGPALAGTPARRTAPRSAVAPTVPPPPCSVPTTDAPPSRPSLKKEKVVEPSLKDIIEDDQYSEPDDGVEIIDMENVRHMDWMAPETLHNERSQPGSKKSRQKRDSPLKDSKGKMKEHFDRSTTLDPSETKATEDIDRSTTFDPSDDEKLEDLEDLVKCFTFLPDSTEDRLYFFQFPSPFPKFVSSTLREDAMDVDAPENPLTTIPDVLGGSSSTKQPEQVQAEPDPKVEGVIGHLEVYRSGVVKMRLGNGILLDVTAATQPSFLQHAVHLDMENKRLNVLGEVNKRFVVSPDVDTLLYAMGLDDQGEGVGQAGAPPDAMSLGQ